MKELVAYGLMLLFLFNFTRQFQAQTVARNETFEKIELLAPNGEKVKEVPVRVRFKNDVIEIESKATGHIIKTLPFSEIKSAEYSYTKNPRWKTGLGLGAASMLFPPLLLVALPIGFSKHRRHWITVKTEKDYAVLKISKSNRKMFIPAFETYTSVKIEAMGDDK